jgi:hypothetical protein
MPTGHWEYEKNNLRVEVHDKLIYSEINNKTDYDAYFDQAWENTARMDTGHRYEFSREFNLLFLITHMAKHFYSYGCGVRMFLDIAVIMIKFNEGIDFNYVWCELKKIKLYVFGKNVFALCKKYFDIDISKAEQEEKIEIDDKTFELISRYIAEGGAFGLNNRTISSYTLRKEYEKISSRKLAQIKVLFEKIFLKYSAMKKGFPILEDFPFFLPFFWVVRGFICIFTKRQSTLEVLKELTAEPSEAEESYEVIKKIGLL